MILKGKEALNQWLNEQLKVRLIVESKSRYIALCFYISKKDGSLWLVQDYSKLNQVTTKNKMPLLLIEEVIDKLKEAKYFNKLSEFKTVDSNYFLVSIFFSPHLLFPFFYLYFWGLRIRVKTLSSSLTSHMIKVTVMCHMEKCRRFRKDDVRLHVDLKTNIWLFRVG